MPKSRRSTNVSYPQLLGPSDANLTLMLDNFDNEIDSLFDAFGKKQQKINKNLEPFAKADDADNRRVKIIATTQRLATQSGSQLQRLKRTLQVRNRILALKIEQLKAAIVQEAVETRKVSMNWAQPGIIATPTQERIVERQARLIDNSEDILQLEEALQDDSLGWT